jgi:hypothetical protein
MIKTPFGLVTQQEYSKWKLLTTPYRFDVIMKPLSKEDVKHD